MLTTSPLACLCPSSFLPSPFCSPLVNSILREGRTEARNGEEPHRLASQAWEDCVKEKIVVVAEGVSGVLLRFSFSCFQSHRQSRLLTRHRISTVVFMRHLQKELQRLLEIMRFLDPVTLGRVGERLHACLPRQAAQRGVCTCAGGMLPGRPLNR